MSITAPVLSLSSAADAAAAANQTAASAAASASGTSSASAAISGNALQQLGSNFNDFLNLLMTQLQNQDPTAPMDTNEFTTELVQFTGVQQQVATNTSLSSLISLTQQGQLLQSSQMVGKQATVSADQISLQNGSGEISFNGTAGEPIAISIVNAAGAPILDISGTATQGVNTWQWNGITNSGSTASDGAYGIAVETGTAGNAPTAVPYSVIGTATGLSSNAGTMDLSIGALTVPLTSVLSVGS